MATALQSADMDSAVLGLSDYGSLRLRRRSLAALTLLRGAEYKGNGGERPPVQPILGSEVFNRPDANPRLAERHVPVRSLPPLNEQ